MTIDDCAAEMVVPLGTEGNVRAFTGTKEVCYLGSAFTRRSSAAEVHRTAVM
jgi:hypothetical protein